MEKGFKGQRTYSDQLETLDKEIDRIQAIISTLEGQDFKPILLTDEMLHVLSAAKAFDELVEGMSNVDILLEYYWERESELMGEAIRLQVGAGFGG